MRRTFFFLFLIGAAVGAWFMFGQRLGTATQYDAVVPELQETTFPQPRSIEWTGTVFAHLAGGQGIAVRRTEEPMLLQAYASGDRTLWNFDGEVRIHGVWVGVDCAYRHTIFSGQCTPMVEIDTITSIASR